MRFLTVLFLVIATTTIAQPTAPPQYKPSVLVEFFTSEGCSSCEVADEFSQEIRAISDSSKSMVYTIDWHVDLWDKSGWKDPFSDSAYTLRQHQMSVVNKQKAVFTPMAFVNGKGALPAGAKKDVGSLIQRTLQVPSEHFLLFSASWMAANKQLLVEYEIKGVPDSLNVVFVMVEKEIFNYVTAGENKGKTLSHHNLVRKVETSKTYTPFGTSIFQFATDKVEFNKYRIIGFLQHKRTMQIMACQMLEFGKN